MLVAGELNAGEEISGEFVVARGDGPKVLEFVEEALDEIAFAVEREIAISRGLAVGLWRNDGDDLALVERIDQRISIVSLVCRSGPADRRHRSMALRKPDRGLARREHHLDRIAEGIDEHDGFWWSIRRAIGRSLARRFFSSPGAMLVRANNGGVDHHVLVVVIARQQLENALENSTLRPPAEALVDDFPVTETLGQIAPRNAGSISVKNSFDEQPVIRRRSSDMAFAAGQKILDPLPLVIA